MGMMGFFLSRFANNCFRHPKLGDWWFFGEYFLVLKASYKNVFVVSFYTYFGFFLLKTGICVIILKNTFLPHFYVHLWLGRVYAKRRVLGSCRTHYWFQTTERSLNSFFQIELQESINRKASLGDIYKEKTISQTLGAEGATN